MQLIRSEQIYWRSVLTRLVAIICHLAERKLAYRGSTDKLYDPQNGNFLGQVELLAKFVPIMNEHVVCECACAIMDTSSCHNR